MPSPARASPGLAAQTERGESGAGKGSGGGLPAVGLLFGRSRSGSGQRGCESPGEGRHTEKAGSRSPRWLPREPLRAGDDAPCAQVGFGPDPGPQLNSSGGGIAAVLPRDRQAGSKGVYIYICVATRPLGPSFLPYFYAVRARGLSLGAGGEAAALPAEGLAKSAAASFLEGRGKGSGD